MQHKPLTDHQQQLIADDLTNLQRIIASKLCRVPRRLIADLIDDAISRLCAAVSSQSINDRHTMRIRACLCALDAIRSAATRDTHAADHLATLCTITIRHNGESLAASTRYGI